MNQKSPKIYTGALNDSYLCELHTNNYHSVSQYILWRIGQCVLRSVGGDAHRKLILSILYNYVQQKQIEAHKSAKISHHKNVWHYAPGDSMTAVLRRIGQYPLRNVEITLGMQIFWDYKNISNLFKKICGLSSKNCLWWVLGT